jgi:hypothetical protein
MSLACAVNQFARDITLQRKWAVIEIRNQLQITRASKWPRNIQAERSHDFKLRPSRRNVFDSGNHLRASALQYISIESQPFGMRLLAY